MAELGWFRTMVAKIFNIVPANQSNTITIREPFTYEASVLRNRLWYRGDPSELEQLYKKTANDNVSSSRFWAAVPSDDLAIRKIHSGLPAMITEHLADVVIQGMDGVALGTEEQTALWQEISEDNDFDELLGESINDVLVAGDGAFKVTIDTDVTKYPIVEFFSGDNVAYVYKRGRLQEIHFYTDYVHDKKDYRLVEEYGKGYINSRLYNDKGKEVPLNNIPQTAEMKLTSEVTFPGDYIMGVPLRFFKSPKWEDRGKSIYESKSDSFDALDEVISQWIDAIRLGRVQKYIPEDMVPNDPYTGAPQKPNPFDNQYIKSGMRMKEEDRNEINTVQPQIAYEAFVSTYANALDMCLQGIVSPATLGIDLKKTDNAEAQREKEKATLYTRGKLIDVLNDVIPQVVDVIMKTNDNLNEIEPQEYEPSIEFGEYASPSFDEKVETVGMAVTHEIMSTEQAIEELRGDAWTEKEKAEEVARIKAEKGTMSIDEPQVGEFDNNNLDDDDNKDDDLDE